MNFQVDIDEETKNLLKDFLQEIKNLNEHLLDFKEMIAPCLGFKVIKNGKKET